MFANFRETERQGVSEREPVHLISLFDKNDIKIFVVAFEAVECNIFLAIIISISYN